jgi:carbon storage regulator CsrA
VLVLTAAIGEAILIGEAISVRVIQISPTQVRLAFEAPKSMNIIREKLKHKLEADGIEVYTTKEIPDETAR